MEKRSLEKPRKGMQFPWVTFAMCRVMVTRIGGKRHRDPAGLLHKRQAPEFTIPPRLGTLREKHFYKEKLSGEGVMYAGDRKRRQLPTTQAIPHPSTDAGFGAP